MLRPAEAEVEGKYWKSLERCRWGRGWRGDAPKKRSAMDWALGVMWKRVQLSLTVWEKRYHVGGQGAHRNSLRAGVDRSLREGLRAPEQAGPEGGACGSALRWHDAQRGARVTRAEQWEDPLPQGAGGLEGEQQVQRAAVVEGHAAPLPVQVHADPPRRGPGAAQWGGLGCRECPQAASAALDGPHRAHRAQPYAALALHRLPSRTEGVVTLHVVVLPRRGSARGGVRGLHLPAVAARPEALLAQHRGELIEARWAVRGLGCPWGGQPDAAAVSGDEQAAVGSARVQGQVGCGAQDRRGAEREGC